MAWHMRNTLSSKMLPKLKYVCKITGMSNSNSSRVPMRREADNQKRTKFKARDKTEKFTKKEYNVRTKFKIICPSLWGKSLGLPVTNCVYLLFFISNCDRSIWCVNLCRSERKQRKSYFVHLPCKRNYKFIYFIKKQL